MNTKPTNETIARTALLVIALVNNALAMSGKNPLPFTDEQFYLFISTALTVAASIWAWWKNNSFTAHAIALDAMGRDAKSAKGK